MKHRSNEGQYPGSDKEIFFKVPSKLPALSLAVLTFIMSNCGQKIKSITEGPAKAVKATAMRDTDADCLLDIIDPHLREPDEFNPRDIRKSLVPRTLSGELSDEVGNQIISYMKECLKAKQPPVVEKPSRKEIVANNPQQKSLPSTPKPEKTTPPKIAPPQNPDPQAQSKPKPQTQPKPPVQKPKPPVQKPKPPVQEPKPEPRQKPKPSSLEEGKTALLEIFPGAAFDSETNTFTINGFGHSVKELKVTVRADGQYVADVKYLDGSNDSFSSDSINIKKSIEAGIASWNSDISDRHNKAKTAFGAKGFRLKTNSKINQIWENGSKTIDINFYKTKVGGNPDTLFRATIISSGNKTAVSDRLFDGLIKKITSALL